MQGGGDTRDLATLPNVTYEGPVKVRPGESGTIAFSVANRYNQTMDDVRVEVEFRVGGDWLAAREINGTFAGAPRFTRGPPLPQSVAPGASIRIEAPFATGADTPPGIYLVSLRLVFRYVNASGAPVDAHFASLGSVDPADRSKVDMENYTGTIDALGLDGVVPDTSMVVDGGGALSLWLAAAAFGGVVVAAGVSYGLLKYRPFHAGRR